MSEQADVLEMMRTRFGFDVVQPTASPNQLRVLGRVPSEQERNWLVGVQHMLSVSEKTPWSVDISRQYFLRSGVLVYAWRVIFQGEGIEQYMEGIVAALSNAPKARFEVEEQALSVNGARSTMNTKGKGASSSGTTPLLLQQRAGMQ